MPKQSWTIEELKYAVNKSKSVRQVLIELKLIPAGGNYKQIQKAIKLNCISTEHFLGQRSNSGKDHVGGTVPIPLKDILVLGSNFQSFKLKKRLFKEKFKEQKCEECGWAKVSEDGRIPLELDHINGVTTDNRIENLRVLCPNCHSLKATHRGKNKSKRTY